MIIGVPREIKDHEYRVGLTPHSARELVARGHEVLVQTHAGDGLGVPDDLYRAFGARIVNEAAEIFALAGLIVKVKEPLAEERKQLRPQQVIFTYLHLAPDQAQTRDLLDSGCIAIAYETITADDGSLPLLTPMSEVAGRLAVQVAARYLEKSQGGAGILMSGVPGVMPAEVLVLGAGVVGLSAVTTAVGMGAQVTVINRSVAPLRRVDSMFRGRVRTEVFSRATIERRLEHTDVIIGAALVPGERAPKLLNREDLARMKPGAVLVDVSIDQGGCFESSRPTTHTNPVYVTDRVTHYCVANMPGAVPQTATVALNNATLPFVLKLADRGWRAALHEDAHFRNGLNICDGRVTHRGVAAAHNIRWIDAQEAIGS